MGEERESRGRGRERGRKGDIINRRPNESGRVGGVGTTDADGDDEVGGDGADASNDGRTDGRTEDRNGRQVSKMPRAHSLGRRRKLEWVHGIVQGLPRSCLTVLPGPAWLLLDTICILFPGPLY